MSIRKIKRNIAEAATGKRLNRYGKNRTKWAAVAAFTDSKFSLGEYLKHRTHRRDLLIALRRERQQITYRTREQAIKIARRLNAATTAKGERP